MEQKRYDEKCDDSGNAAEIREQRCVEKSDDEDSLSTLTCIGEEKEAHEDAQVLRLLDAMEHLLSCRESLASSLSKGWMEIASARYSMGPSRIDQALFSLKPCLASTQVFVSRNDGFEEDEGCVKEGEKVCDSQQDYQFVLRGPLKDDPRNQSSQSEVLSQSHLRQRHTSGLVNMRHTDNDTEEGDLLGNKGDTTQDVFNKSKASDSLAWFGTLVSPHLRVAQTSFKEALEVIVEMATTQSTILTAYRQIKESGGLV